MLLFRSSTTAAFVMAALVASVYDTIAQDEGKYPDLKGQWIRPVLRNEITIIDNALTHPWTVTQTYRRLPNPRPVWGEQECSEGQAFVLIGKENYMLSSDGYLMPTKKGQTPPDLRYFSSARD